MQERPLFTQEELDRLLPHGHAVSYPAKTTLVREGDTSDFVLYLHSGNIKAVTGKPESLVHIYMPGSVVGELAALTGQPRSAKLVAMSDIEAHLLPGPAWMDFLANEMRASLAVMGNLAMRLIDRDHPQAGESVTNSEARLGNGLRKLVESGYGTATEDGYLIPEFTQRDLGALSGLSRESVAIVLRRLREDKTVSTGRGNLTIHDMEAIKRLSQPTLE